MSKTPSAKPDLRLVSAESEIYDLMRAPATTADRVKRLQMEARALANLLSRHESRHHSY